MPTPKIGKKVFEEHMAGEQKPKETEPRPMDPDEATRFLLEFLPKHVTEIFQDACVALGIPLWQSMLGFLMRTYDQMILPAQVYSPYLMSNWASGIKADAARPCTNCQKLFKSQHHDARYCCSLCFFGKVAERGHDKDCPAVNHVG